MNRPSSAQDASLTTAPIAASVLTAHQPEFIRVPKPGQRCPITSLGRSVIYDLIAREKIKSITLRQKGKIRGCRLIIVESLLGYLRELAAEQANMPIAAAGPTQTRPRTNLIEGEVHTGEVAILQSTVKATKPQSAGDKVLMLEVDGDCFKGKAVSFLVDNPALQQGKTAKVVMHGRKTTTGAIVACITEAKVVSHES
jgi:hypothetical protein